MSPVVSFAQPKKTARNSVVTKTGRYPCDARSLLFVLDMLPIPSVCDMPYCLTSDAVGGGDARFCLSGQNTNSDVLNVALLKPRRPNKIADNWLFPPLLYGVSNVVRPRAAPEMRRVYTGRVVALVKDMKPLGYWLLERFK